MEIIFKNFDKKTIADIVHDRFLDAENICWDKNSNCVKILYFSDAHGQVLEGAILLKNVVDLIFVDNEKIQYYDLNFIDWVEKEKKISIITNIPLFFYAIVKEFEIAITTVGD